jgi:hypothetical protein
MGLLIALGRGCGVVGIAIAGLASTLILTATQSMLIRQRGERSLSALVLTGTLIFIALAALYVVGYQ